MLLLTCSWLVSPVALSEMTGSITPLLFLNPSAQPFWLASMREPANS